MKKWKEPKKKAVPKRITGLMRLSRRPRPLSCAPRPVIGQQKFDFDLKVNQREASDG